MTSTVSAISGGATGKTLTPELQRALGRVTEIGSLPEVTTRIVEVVENPRATARDVYDVVRADPALAAKILKIVNSAFYGLPSQIASLDRAIVMVGLSALKNLALATSLSRLLKAEDLSPEFRTRELWRHSLAVGVCARQITQLARGAAGDEAFVAGLMHDLGLIIVQQLFPLKLGEVVQACVAQPQNFCQLEERLVGGDHQTFGAALAARWKFPPALRNTLGYHHEPSSLQPEFQKLTATIYIADTLCCRARLGIWLTAALQEIPEWMLAMVGATPAQLDEIMAELPARVDNAEQIFSA